MTIVIKKRISLDFLGEEYAGSYLTFNSVALKDYDVILSKSEALSKKDNAASLAYIREMLSERFVEGEIKEEGSSQTVTKENLFDLPGDTLVECFSQLMGNASPKV